MDGVDGPIFMIPLWADLTAVGLGGIQGALFASGFRGQRRLDLLGVAIIGVVVGMGGGIIRDMLLNSPLPPCRATGTWSPPRARPWSGCCSAAPLRIGSTASSSGWTRSSSASSARSARARPWHSDCPLIPAVFVGVCSAVGGGILPDVFMGLPVAIMHVGSLYAVAAAAGCLVLAVSNAFGVACSPPQRSSA